MKNLDIPTNPLWGARFSAGASSLLEEINSSIHFDHQLANQDIDGSIAHAKMLYRVGVLNKEELTQIETGLEKIALSIAAGRFSFSAQLEDVHMNIENALYKDIGLPARKLHTARSRNDQVALDMKLWARQIIDALDVELHKLISTIAKLAGSHHATAMPGFTHMQAAQPVTLGHHLLAYGEMFMRDRGRLADARNRLNESPLGAAALAGTSHPIDREMTASLLGFSGPAKNSIDAVSDRDFLLEFLAVASILAIHMSRLGEEVVIWCSSQFAYASLSDDLSAGSSIMPQKKNPDAAELIRAKSGRVVGSLVTLLTVMKGLPLAYSRDMQEDKEASFDAANTVNLCVRVSTAILSGLHFNPHRMREDALVGNTLATDLADWLVAHENVPFREAHHVVGRVIKFIEAQGMELKTAPIDLLRELEPLLANLPMDFLTLDRSLASRQSLGGTAPTLVFAAANELQIRNDSFGQSINEGV
ncbi:argininosuccinate lyase [Hydrogenophaga soli]